ncbi:hypothetical protein NB689_002385 [Xanthomonas sacchari]|nr:hypothetical protein [Xanthomonas sacchari]
MVQRALRFRVEGADRIDVLVQQFDPQRRVGAHRVHVEQAAAHGEVARVHHLRHVAVSRAFQSPLLRIQVQALAHAQVETAADDVAQRRHPLHQRLHRYHHDALGQRRQPVQRGQALADDVRVRTELVVGQGFPVRERHHRQARIVAEQAVQVGFELMRALVVAGDHQQRPAVRGRGTGDVPGQGGGGRGGAPVRAELAGLGQRRNGEGKGRHGPTSLARSGPGARDRGHVRAGAEAACGALDFPGPGSRVFSCPVPAPPAPGPDCPDAACAGSPATRPTAASARCVRARRRRAGPGTCGVPT